MSLSRVLMPSSVLQCHTVALLITCDKFMAWRNLPSHRMLLCQVSASSVWFYRVAQKMCIDHCKTKRCHSNLGRCNFAKYWLVFKSFHHQTLQKNHHQISRHTLTVSLLYVVKYMTPSSLTVVSGPGFCAILYTTAIYSGSWQVTTSS